MLMLLSFSRTNVFLYDVMVSQNDVFKRDIVCVGNLDLRLHA